MYHASVDVRTNTSHGSAAMFNKDNNRLVHEVQALATSDKVNRCRGSLIIILHTLGATSVAVIGDHDPSFPMITGILTAPLC